MAEPQLAATEIKEVLIEFLTDKKAFHDDFALDSVAIDKHTNLYYPIGVFETVRLRLLPTTLTSVVYTQACKLTITGEEHFLRDGNNSEKPSSRPAVVLKDISGNTLNMSDEYFNGCKSELLAKLEKYFPVATHIPESEDLERRWTLVQGDNADLFKKLTSDILTAIRPLAVTFTPAIMDIVKQEKRRWFETKYALKNSTSERINIIELKGGTDDGARQCAKAIADSFTLALYPVLVKAIEGEALNLRRSGMRVRSHALQSTINRLLDIIT